MKKHYNPIFHVYSCFIILLTSSCKAQYKKNITAFFQQLSKEAYNYCLNNDDYKYFKEKKNKKAIILLENSCKESIKDYRLYTGNTLSFMDSLLKYSSADFIIVNKPLKSISYSNPVLTILKLKNENKYNVIHNDYAYNQEIKEYHLVTDSEMVGFDAENIFNILENYFYYKKNDSKIFTTLKEAKTQGNFSVYYIVARVSGKIITKKIYFADDYNNQ